MGDAFVQQARAGSEPATLVSVIVPTFNRADLLPATIDSVLGQTHQDLEIIVVDDGSQDDTADVVRHYVRAQGPRVAYIRQDNAGPAAARNTGIRAARAPYIAFLDSDDTWTADKLEVCLDVLQAGGFDWVVSSYVRTDLGSESPPVVKRLSPPQWNPATGEVHLLIDGIFFFSELAVNTGAVLARRSCFDRAGVFDPSFRIGEDWDLWLRFEEAGLRCGYVDRPLYTYRVHAGGITRSAQIEPLRAHVRLAFKHAAILGLHDPLIRSSLADFLWTCSQAFRERGAHARAAGCLARSTLLAPRRAFGRAWQKLTRT